MNDIFQILFKPPAADDKIPEPGGDGLPRALFSQILFDHPFDTKYARIDPSFHCVVHVFQQQWHGIRSAVGVLPGHKIALPESDIMGPKALNQIGAYFCETKAKKIVFHGLSATAAILARYAASQGLEAYLVWHGNLAQLAWDPERSLFQQALEFCKSGIFCRTHMMKAGLGEIYPNSFPLMLLNSPPIVQNTRLIPPFSGTKHVGLVSAPLDIRKNLYSSLVGAALSTTLAKVLCYSKPRVAFEILKRCDRIKYRDHERHLRLLSQIDISINVTVIDCHPMVDLEALAMGAVPLTGPLHLDALQSHELTAMGTIENPFDVRAIADRIDYIARIESSEIKAVLNDYSAALSQISISRYSEFLRL